MGILVRAMVLALGHAWTIGYGLANMVQDPINRFQEYLVPLETFTMLVTHKRQF